MHWWDTLSLRDARPGDMFVEYRRLELPASRWLLRTVALSVWVILVSHFLGAGWPDAVGARIWNSISPLLSGRLWTPERFLLLCVLMGAFILGDRSVVLASWRVLYVAAFPIVATYQVYSRLISPERHRHAPPLVDTLRTVQESRGLGMRKIVTRRRVPRGTSIVAIVTFLVTWDAVSAFAVAVALTLLAIAFLEAGLRCFVVSTKPNQRFVHESSTKLLILILALSELALYVVEGSIRRGPEDRVLLRGAERMFRGARRCLARLYRFLRTRRSNLAVAMTNGSYIYSVSAYALAWVCLWSLTLRLMVGLDRLLQEDALNMALAGFLGNFSTSHTRAEPWLLVGTLMAWITLFAWLGPLLGLFQERRDYFWDQLRWFIKDARVGRRLTMTAEGMARTAADRLEARSRSTQQ